MLELQDVPNFQYILIHCGNTDEHTAGCILLGDSQENNVLLKDGFIGKSTQAYKRIYPRIAKALKNNEKVEIEIVDIKNVTGDITDTAAEYKITSEMVWDKLAEINGNLKSIDVKLDGKKII